MVNIKPMQKWERWGRLVIVWEYEKRSSWIFEKCICDCWNIIWTSRNHLRRWATKSCWCLMKETSRRSMIKMTTRHWMYGTRIYSIYTWAKWRCENSKMPNYYLYWWRWIKFLWESFEAFYKDMYQGYENHVKKFWEENTTLDRIDTNWDYCKENCRWATKKEQQNNKRDNHIIMYKWKRFTLQELSEHTWIKREVLYRRIKKGWDIKDIITIPVLPRWTTIIRYKEKDGVIQPK